MKFNRITLCTLLLVVLTFAGIAMGAGKKDLIVVTNLEPKSLDPQDASGAASEEVCRKIYEGLVDFGDNYEPVPKLAESWSVSKEGKTWTFKLRKGVKFHSGTDFNAQAVKASFDRLFSGKFGRSSYFGTAIKVRVVNEYIVAFDLKEPFALFVNRLAAAPGLIVDPAFAKDALKSAGLKREPSGTGPFRIGKWSAKEITLEANKDYWQGEPKLRSVVYKFVPNPVERAKLVSTNSSVHVAQNLTIPAAKSASGDRAFTLHRVPFIAVFAIIPNTTHPILKDARVRRALAYAINRISICKNVWDGFAVPAYSNAAPCVYGAGGQGTAIPYDPQQAKKLLEEAGWNKVSPDGIRINAAGERLSVELMTTDDPKGKLYKAYQSFAKAIGMELKVRQVERQAWSSLVNSSAGKDSTQLTLHSEYPTYGEAYGVYHPLFCSENFPPKGINYAYYKNDEVVRDIHAAGRENDPKRRQMLYDKIEKQLMIDFPRIPVYSFTTRCAVRKEVKNLRVTPMNILVIDHTTDIK